VAGALSARAQAGNQPPPFLRDVVDVSRDYCDFTNVFYAADRLTGFDLLVAARRWRGGADAEGAGTAAAAACDFSVLSTPASCYKSLKVGRASWPRWAQEVIPPDDGGS
jgi:hypothetical protein